MLLYDSLAQNGQQSRTCVHVSRARRKMERVDRGNILASLPDGAKTAGLALIHPIIQPSHPIKTSLGPINNI
jgi:hypothetical protein